MIIIKVRIPASAGITLERWAGYAVQDFSPADMVDPKVCITCDGTRAQKKLEIFPKMK